MNLESNIIMFPAPPLIKEGVESRYKRKQKSTDWIQVSSLVPV